MKLIIQRFSDGARVLVQKRLHGPEIPVADSFAPTERGSSARTVQEFYELIKAAGEALDAGVEERDESEYSIFGYTDEDEEGEDEPAD